jgi:hypothetical protein
MTVRHATPESFVLRSCLDLLAIERIWHVRLNTGSFALESKGKRRFFRAGVKGMADILATPLVQRIAVVPVVLWIEVKSETGRQRPDQRAFQQAVEEAGHFYLLARSGDDIVNWLSQHNAIHMIRPAQPVQANPGHRGF